MNKTYTRKFSTSNGTSFANQLARLLKQTEDKLIKLEVNVEQETAEGTFEEAPKGTDK